MTQTHRGNLSLYRRFGSLIHDLDPKTRYFLDAFLKELPQLAMPKKPFHQMLAIFLLY